MDEKEERKKRIIRQIIVNKNLNLQSEECVDNILQHFNRQSRSHTIKYYLTLLGDFTIIQMAGFPWDNTVETSDEFVRRHKIAYAGKTGGGSATMHIYQEDADALAIADQDNINEKLFFEDPFDNNFISAIVKDENAALLLCRYKTPEPIEEKINPNFDLMHARAQDELGLKGPPKLIRLLYMTLVFSDLELKTYINDPATIPGAQEIHSDDSFPVLSREQCMRICHDEIGGRFLSGLIESAAIEGLIQRRLNLGGDFGFTIAIDLYPNRPFDESVQLQFHKDSTSEMGVANVALDYLFPDGFEGRIKGVSVVASDKDTEPDERVQLTPAVSPQSSNILFNNILDLHSTPSGDNLSGLETSKVEIEGNVRHPEFTMVTKPVNLRLKKYISNKIKENYPDKFRSAGLVEQQYLHEVDKISRATVDVRSSGLRILRKWTLTEFILDESAPLDKFMAGFINYELILESIAQLRSSSLIFSVNIETNERSVNALFELMAEYNSFLGGKAPGKNDNLTSIKLNNNPIIDVNDKSSNTYDPNSNKTPSSNQSKITVNIVKNFNEILDNIPGNYIILKVDKPILFKKNKNKQGGKKNKKYNFLKLVKTKKYKKSRKSRKSKKNRNTKNSRKTKTRRKD